MGIITGILTYFFGFIINLIDSAVSLFLSTLGFSISSFEEFFPAAADFYDVIIGFSIGLLFLQFIFQIFRNFGVMLDIEAEDPLKMSGKVFLFFGMIFACRSINQLVIDLLMGPYNIFLNYDVGLDFSFWDLVDNIFDHMLTFVFMTIVYLIMLIIIGFQFLKFLMEVVERYIVFVFVLYTAPLAYSTGPFKSTAQIFKSWCRMLASQALLLLLNVWCIKVFISGLGLFIQHGKTDFFYYLLLYGFLKFSQKVDTLLRIIGMNTASTGSTMRSIGGAVAGIAYSIKNTGQAVSKLLGGGALAAVGGSNARTNSTGSSQKSGTGGITLQKADTDTNLVKGKSQKGVSSLSDAVESKMNDAKQTYADDVLFAAKSQLSAPTEHENSINEFVRSSAGDGISLTNQNSVTSGLDSEVKEGVTNLARGLPHTKFNNENGKYEGGGFKALLGDDANIIGSSEMVPSESYVQKSVKMPDGTTATIYSNSSTGSSQAVKFDSVDNGVITGSVSSISNRTGEVGHSEPFTAIHDSIPNANKEGTRVSDGDGGSYYVSSHGDTSMFKPYSSTMQQTGEEHNTKDISLGISAVSQISDSYHDGLFSDSPSTDAVSIGNNSRFSPVGSYDNSMSENNESSISASENIRDTHTEKHVDSNNSQSIPAHLHRKYYNTSDTNPGNLRKFSKNNPENFEVFKKTGLQEFESYKKNIDEDNLPNL